MKTSGDSIPSSVRSKLHGVVSARDAFECAKACGIFITENEFQDLILPQLTDTVTEEPRLLEEINVPSDRLQKILERLHGEGTFRHDDMNTLRSAFLTLDPERRGYVDAKILRDIFPTIEEFKAFCSLGKEKNTDRFYYNEYLFKSFNHLRQL